MCTHLHFDHIGWNTRLDNGRWVPTFPNARYLFSRKDYEYFATVEAGHLHYEGYQDSVLPVVEHGLADIVEDDHVVHREIEDGVWLEPANGHSPGCCTVHAQRGGPRSVFSGDVIHHPLQLVRPELAMSFDEDQALAPQVRIRLLDSLADSDSLLFPAHFRGISAGHVKRDGDAYSFRFLDQ
jgi:glyoxylase-like metal-dependent hydrolase (beta-lactamase superfamily II)